MPQSFWGLGGAIFCNSDNLANWFQDYRDYTDKPACASRYNDKMTDIESALARSRLRRIDAAINWRQKLAIKYDSALKPLAQKYGLILPNINDNRLWYRYTVVLPESNLDMVVEKLNSKKIGAARPVEKWHQDFIDEQTLTISEIAFERLLSLPFHAGITDEDICYCVENLENILMNNLCKV